MDSIFRIKVSVACLVAVGDELLQGAHLLVDPVPSPLQCKGHSNFQFTSHQEDKSLAWRARICRRRASTEQ